MINAQFLVFAFYRTLRVCAGVASLTKDCSKITARQVQANAGHFVHNWNWHETCDGHIEEAIGLSEEGKARYGGARKTSRNFLQVCARTALFSLPRPALYFG
jgi:hypothetical protein